MQETAGAHLVRRVPVARPEELVEKTRARLLATTWDTVEELFLVDADGRFLAAVPTVDLISAPGDVEVKDLAKAREAVRPQADQEQVGMIALHGGMAAVPVVDEEGRFLGAVPPLALIEILHREHVEDLHRLAGITREHAFLRRALEAPPLRRVRSRLPWLLVGVAGSIAATMLMHRFEHVIAEHIAVAFFVPAIVYLADAVGTQTETITVRGLSLSRVCFSRLAFREIGTGFLLAGILAATAWPLAWAYVADARLAASVSLAVLAACGAATTVGVLLPWMLQRLGFDPAFGSGPLATAVQDLLSLAAYFLIVLAVAA